MAAPERTLIAGGPRDADLDSARWMIGRRIAGLRKERGLSVRALANAAGVTGGFISQTENGYTMPSVGTLIAIASALGTRVAEFFEPLEHSGEVLHPGERTVYAYTEHGVVDEVISDDPSGELEVLRSRIEPGCGTGDEPYVHGSKVETVYVLSGQLELAVGERRVTLGAGDSVTFSGELPHGAWNRGDVPAEAIWVAAPARY